MSFKTAKFYFLTDMSISNIHKVWRSTSQSRIKGYRPYSFRMAAEHNCCIPKLHLYKCFTITKVLDAF